MPINDNNPERRNLTVLSTSIIAYYVGDATIKGDKLGLPLVDLEFHNQLGLACLVWAIHSWFILRYWLQHKVKLNNEFFLELHGEHYLQWLFYSHFMKAPRKKHPRMKDAQKISYVYTPQPGLAEEIQKKGALKGIVYFMNDAGKPASESLPLGGYRKLIVIALLGFRLFFVKPSLSANLGPLVLAAIAIGFGVFYSALPYVRDIV